MPRTREQNLVIEAEFMECQRLCSLLRVCFQGEHAGFLDQNVPWAQGFPIQRAFLCIGASMSGAFWACIASQRLHMLESDIIRHRWWVLFLWYLWSLECKNSTSISVFSLTLLAPWRGSPQHIACKWGTLWEYIPQNYYSQTDLSTSDVTKTLLSRHHNCLHLVTSAVGSLGVIVSSDWWRQFLSELMLEQFDRALFDQLEVFRHILDGDIYVGHSLASVLQCWALGEKHLLQTLLFFPSVDASKWQSHTEFLDGSLTSLISCR